MSNRAVAFALRVAALMLAAFAVQRLVVLPQRANHELDAVERRTEAAAAMAGPEQAIVARDNVARLDRVAAGARTSVDYYILAGDNARIAGDLETALARYSGALTVDQRPEIYFSRGMVRVELHDVDGAVADLVRAVEFSPPTLHRIKDEVLRERVEQALRR